MTDWLKESLLRRGWYVSGTFAVTPGRWRAEASYGAAPGDPQPDYKYFDDGATAEEAKAAVMRRAAADKDWPTVAALFALTKTRTP